MAAFTGDDAKRIWDQIFQSIFSDEMSIRIAAQKIAELQDQDNTYFDLRNTARAKTIQSIHYLIENPELTWQSRQNFVQSLPLVQQGFIYDRFQFAEEYLGKVGHKEFFKVEKVEDFLRWGLIEIWELRHREGEWE